MNPKIIVFLLIGCITCQDSDEESNPFMNAAASFLQEAMQERGNGDGGLGALGGMVQQILQNGGGKQLGDMFTGRSEGGNPAADVVMGIANMLSNQKGKEGGVDVNVLGQVMDMVGAVTGNPKREVDNSENEIAEDGQNVDWENLIGLASNFFPKDSNGGGGAMEGLLNLLPMLSSGFSGNHVHFADSEMEDAEEHEKYEKSSFLPPFLSNIYEYWDHFKKSELGRTLWSKSGLEGIFQLFTDKDGYFQVDRIFESMENTTFRRRWIKSLSMFIGGWVKHISDPATQARYLANAQFIGNAFLKVQGYPKSAQFDASRPAESLSFLIDALFKRQFGLKINSATYIKPAISYIQDVFKLGQSKGFSLSHLSSLEIGSKLSEIINGDVIEPVLRVWRAYRYSFKNPQCDKLLMCSLNSKDNHSEIKTGLKPGIIKISSLIASWYLSGKTGTAFWKLYNAVTEDHNCQTKYPIDCKQFFEEDIRVTTEYAHSEL